MLLSVQARVTARYLAATAPPDDLAADAGPEGRTEAGFEIAQSMGIALLGLIVAAGFATALEALGLEVITKVREQLRLGGG